MGEQSGSKRAWRWRLPFSRIHPLVFLAIYLLAVPVFGAIYHAQPPASFYAPNLKYEKPARADANRVAADLYTAIEGGLALPPKAPPTPDSWRVDPRSVGVRDVTVGEDHILHFTVLFKATRETPGHAEIRWSMHAQTPVQERVTSFPDGGPIISHLISPQPETIAKEVTGGLGISNSSFAEMVFRSRDPIVQTTALSWSPAEDARLQTFDRGRQGDPSAVSGDFWRMVYFSATTITTTGYGDIIPLTGPARALTGIEAVLGWVLAGLFLNAAATRLSRKSNAP